MEVQILHYKGKKIMSVKSFLVCIIEGRSKGGNTHYHCLREELMVTTIIIIKNNFLIELISLNYK